MNFYIFYPPDAFRLSVIFQLTKDLMGKMSKVNKIVPKSVIVSIAVGLILMAIFTLIWAGIAGTNLSDAKMWLCFILADVIAVIFIGYAIYLFFIVKKFPEVEDSDKETRKKMLRKYGVIFGGEGLLIAVSVLLLSYFNFENLVIPTIAIIVGLHFLPMASLFQRKLDYYTGILTTLIGILGLIFALTKMLPDNRINVMVGLGVSLVTSFYGFYMIKLSQEYKSALKRMPAVSN